MADNFIFLIISIVFTVHLNTIGISGLPYQNIQSIHLLDPAIPEFKYYASWNSDQWVQWIRNRFVQETESLRAGVASALAPSSLLKSWVNIIIIASETELNDAFSNNSQRAFPEDEQKRNSLWSSVPFTTYVVVRQKPSIAEDLSATGNVSEPWKPGYNVFRCDTKKMLIHATVENDTQRPIRIETIFPRAVKNPKTSLRIPLTTCNKVGQTRGLLDEIKFQLGNK